MSESDIHAASQIPPYFTPPPHGPLLEYRTMGPDGLTWILANGDHVTEASALDGMSPMQLQILRVYLMNVLGVIEDTLTTKGFTTDGKRITVRRMGESFPGYNTDQL